MIDLTDLKAVKDLQANLRMVFDSPQGKEIMTFLEDVVGYDQSIFNPATPELSLINDGKRQVVATIKTLLKLTPEQVVVLIKSKEE